MPFFNCYNYVYSPLARIVTVNLS